MAATFDAAVLLPATRLAAAAVCFSLGLVFEFLLWRARSCETPVALWATAVDCSLSFKQAHGAKFGVRLEHGCVRVPGSWKSSLRDQKRRGTFWEGRQESGKKGTPPKKETELSHTIAAGTAAILGARSLPV